MNPNTKPVQKIPGNSSVGTSCYGFEEQLGSYIMANFTSASSNNASPSRPSVLNLYNCGLPDSLQPARFTNTSVDETSLPRTTDSQSSQTDTSINIVDKTETRWVPRLCYTERPVLIENNCQLRNHTPTSESSRAIGKKNSISEFTRNETSNIENCSITSNIPDFSKPHRRHSLESQMSVLYKPDLTSLKEAGNSKRDLSSMKLAVKLHEESANQIKPTARIHLESEVQQNGTDHDATSDNSVPDSGRPHPSVEEFLSNMKKLKEQSKQFYRMEKQHNGLTCDFHNNKQEGATSSFKKSSVPITAEISSEEDHRFERNMYDSKERDEKVMDEAMEYV
ncbi:uncharacterized protein LOC111088789, partial [Limulus polyphemus]|uniref:Uncharacterized protein LOC111088789 n=1 Tax=Limulus polyphemus TaxID=6850 RepID=A0ABM1THW8_LIMPO